MERKIVLSDHVNVSDSSQKIRGYVILTKSDGTVIFKKDNMIVENGRTYIRNLVHSKLSGGTTENRSFANLRLGTGTALTTPTTIASAITKLGEDIELSVSNVTIPIIPVNSIDSVSIQISTQIDGADYVSEIVSELGILLSDGSLFSRLVFEPVPLTSGTTYNLTYYIYF